MLGRRLAFERRHGSSTRTLDQLVTYSECTLRQIPVLKATSLLISSAIMAFFQPLVMAGNKRHHEGHQAVASESQRGEASRLGWVTRQQ